MQDAIDALTIAVWSDPSNTEASELLDNERPFDALKRVRMLLPLEVAAAMKAQELNKEVA